MILTTAFNTTISCKCCTFNFPTHINRHTKFLKTFSTKRKSDEQYLIIHHYSSAFEFKISYKLLESLSRFIAHTQKKKYSGILMKKENSIRTKQKKNRGKKILVKYSEQIFFIATNFLLLLFSFFFYFCVWFLLT